MTVLKAELSCSRGINPGFQLLFWQGSGYLIDLLTALVEYQCRDTANIKLIREVLIYLCVYPGYFDDTGLFSSNLIQHGI